MAKTSGPPEKKARYPYPSRFGSHLSMMNKEKSGTHLGVITLTDEYGDYETNVDRLDNGMADPNRYAIARLSRLFANNRKE